MRCREIHHSGKRNICCSPVDCYQIFVERFGEIEVSGAFIEDIVKSSEMEKKWIVYIGIKFSAIFISHKDFNGE